MDGHGGGLRLLAWTAARLAGLLNEIPTCNPKKSLDSPVWITHLPTPQGCGQPYGFMSYPDLELTRSSSLPNILLEMNPKYTSPEPIY